MEEFRLKYKDVRFDTIIFHYPCMDGLVAAWVMKRVYGNHQYQCPELIPKSIDQIPIDPALYTNKKVIMVDIVTADYQKINAEAASLVILDHHKTSQSKLAGVENAFFDMNQSGAGLMMNFLHDDAFIHDIYSHELVKFVEERDLFKFKRQNSKDFNAGLVAHLDATCGNSLELRLTTLSEIVDNRYFNDLIQLGSTMSALRTSKINAIANHAVRYSVTLPNHDVRRAVIETADHDLVSDLGNHLISTVRDIDMVILWRYSHEKEEYWYSLRSDDAHDDISAVCAMFGGGGHRNAAGFSSLLHPKELFKYVAIV